ncbi:MAG: septal ring lytic transglycosylase RlpA family protein [Chthoniobacterales bacterium]
MPRRINHSRLRYLFISLTIVAFSCSSCRRGDPAPNVAREKQRGEESGVQDAGPRLQPGAIWNNGKPLDVLSAWYDVPDDSLAKRRADGEEFTAAHNRLPIGTLVEVTNLQNGKSARVRITDRGIHDRRVKLDLCKPAAEQLGIVGKGLARVRMQVIAELAGGSSDTSRVTSSP